MKHIGLFAAGLLFGTAGLKILTSKDAKKVYAHTTAAALRAKDCIMHTVTSVREGADDIYADAKADALTAFLPVYDNLELRPRPRPLRTLPHKRLKFSTALWEEPHSAVLLSFGGSN